jgi:hypothetical protein
MQDALLMYYMIANLLHAGYFADIAKVIRWAMKQLCAATGSRNTNGAQSAVARTRAQVIGFVPAAYQEFEDWAERLTRMESYVLSMR